jgi:hypothetical protein
MGNPNRTKSSVVKYVLDGEAGLGSVTDDDFVMILDGAIEILRGLERHVRFPTFGEQLDTMFGRVSRISP